MPSSKWWASTTVSVLTALVMIITALQNEGVELPELVVLAGAVMGPIAVYLKRENNPSPSAIEAMG